MSGSLDILEQLISVLEQLAEHVPVEIFAFLGSFIEELIAPVPSPVVMTLAGSMVEAQGMSFWYLFVVAVIAAAGKTIAAIILYLLADKTEDVVLGKLGRYVGITHAQVEKVGARFTGTPKDYLTLFLIRATPIIPSAPISLICGLISIPKKVFIVCTYFGTIVRDFVYLYIGFTGLGAAAEITEGIEGASSIITIVLGVVGLAVFGWILYKKYGKPKSSNSQS